MCSHEKLALEGGERAVRTLGPFPPKIGRDELLELIDLWDFSAGSKQKIRAIIESDPDIRGPHLFRYYNPKPSRVQAAEEAMAGIIGVRHCLAVNSCTSALVASCRALGIGAGDAVIVPAYTFFATASAVVAANAVPIIADIDETLCLDPSAIEKAITRRVKAIAPVHMRGAPAPMDAIMDIANKRGIPVIEDVAQAGGGSFRGKRLGSIGAMGCFSFDYYKTLTCGEGGFVTTSDAWLYDRARSWHDTAACWRPDRYAQERRTGELFCGENYRMSELQGAVAIAQIRKADSLIARLRAAKKRIKDEIGGFPGLAFRRLTDESGDIGTCLAMFLPTPEITRQALDAMKAEGVPAGGVYDAEVRDWHVYAYWDHILDMKSVAPDGLPWSGMPKRELPRYARDMSPKTLELLSRSLLITVNPYYSEEDCAAIAKGVNKVLHALLR